VTGTVKSLTVAPFTCTVEPTFTAAPVVVKLATRAVTLVPKGTVTPMRVPTMVPTAAGETMLKAVISFAGSSDSSTVIV
jgi:hypothetical protein